MIVRERNGMHALHRERAVRRLETEGAAVRRRPQRRALGLSAEGGGHHAGADAGRRPAGRAAGRAFRIERVGRRTGVADREFGRDGLAEDDRSALAQRVHASGVLRGAAVLERRAVHLGRQVARRHDVLDADRAAVEHRQRSSQPVARRRFVCGFARGVEVERDERLDARLARFDLRDAALDEVTGRVAAVAKIGGGASERDDVGIGPGFHGPIVKR